MATYAAGTVVEHASHIGSASTAITAVVGLSVLLTMQQLAAIAVAPLREAVARSIDGRFRRQVAEISLTPTGITHLENPALANQFALASRDLDQFTPGNAATAQVSVICQAVSAAACVVIISSHSLLGAAVIAVLALTRRMVVQRLFVGLNWVKIRAASAARQFRYWQDFAGGAEAGKEIRVFGLQHWVVAKFRTAMLSYLRGIWRARIPVVLRTWIPLLFGIALAATGFITLLPRHGAADAQTVVQGTTALIAVLAASSTTWEDFEVAHGRPMIDAAQELHQRLKPTASSAAAGPTMRAAAPPAITFESVDFHYPEHDTPVLNGLNIDIKPGEVLAIVGVNGAGKTTITKLLARLYEPVAGRITADGIDIQDLAPEAWRRRLAVVVQGFLRYDLSVRENVTLGAPEHHGDREFFASVADTLDLNDIVAPLPQGWDTVLSRGRSGGSELSGGQWQRIAIARALFALRAGRTVLVLDEPTAHLDAEAEFDVFRKVVEAARGASVLLISHRLSTVRLADRIAVIRDGKVSEIGTHEDLVRSGADYARMFATQARQFLETS
ncbi:ABC transporter ATP-binding protein [Streptomyces sp. NPDC050085]|uniref:ABC transporter ATP-binding protein n=1 Tax=Streptomyces sp. NPDC050085 TaxID=3365600 RepID=UPI00378D0BFD